MCKFTTKSKIIKMTTTCCYSLSNEWQFFFKFTLRKLGEIEAAETGLE